MRVWCGGSWGHRVIMPRAGSVRCCAYHSCHKRSDKKRSFGHVYPVVPTVVQRHPQLFKAEHDGVLCNQHGCKLAAISGGRVEADNTLGGEVVEIDSPPSPLSLSSSLSPALVQLASAALQPPPRRPNDSCDDRALSEGGAVDDNVDLLRHTSSLYCSSSSLLLSSSSSSSPTSSPQSSLSLSSSLSASRALSPPPLIGWSNQYDRLHPITEQLEAVYALYTKYCSPMHGPDKDVGNLPEKRARTQRPLDPTPRAVMPLTDASLPRTVAVGYAECRRGSFDDVCKLLCSETLPVELRIGADSTFLDIGRGYGRCVVHARLRCGVEKSVGIEAVATRHVEAERMMRVHLPKQFPSLFQAGRLQWNKSIQLLEGDATHLHVRPTLLAATHVYMFDWLFNEEALSVILSILAGSANCRVLVSCQKPDGMVMQSGVVVSIGCLC